MTRMLTDIYGSIMEIKPRVKVSAAVWGIYDHTKLPQGMDKSTGYSWTSTGLQDFHQDSVGWINRGCMDARAPVFSLARRRSHRLRRMGRCPNRFWLDRCSL